MRQKGGFYTVLQSIVVIWGRAAAKFLTHIDTFYHEELLIKRLRTRRDEHTVRATLAQHGFTYLRPAQFLDKLAKILLVGTVARINDIKGIGKRVMQEIVKQRGKP